MRKVFYLSIILIFVILILYFYNDGWLPYSIQKKALSPLSLVEYYTNINFPTETIVEFSEFLNDSPDKRDECFKIVFLVPTDELSNLFREECRDYNPTPTFAIPSDMSQETVDFTCSMYNTVRKWNLKTQRTIQIAVMKSEGIYNKVYISIDKLGWYLWDKWQLGGIG